MQMKYGKNVYRPVRKLLVVLYWLKMYNGTNLVLGNVWF